MNQKFEDIKLVVQNDRRVWAACGVVVLMFLIWSLSSGSPRSSRRGPSQLVASNPGSGATESYTDLTLAFRQDLNKALKSSKENSRLIKDSIRESTEYRERTTGIFQTLVDRIEELNREIDNLAQITADQGGRGALSVEEQVDAEPQPDELLPYGFDKTDIPLPPPPPRALRIKVISPGDIVRLKLLTGVNAPVDGTPYPVVFKIVSPISGPDGSLLDIGEARLIAAAQGSEADGRVLFRLTNLALRHKDGRRSVVPIDGWIVGEDGVRGMKGKLIDKLGRVIATTFGVSFAAALGESLDQRSDAVVVTDGGVFELDGNEVDSATASAITDSANRLGQLLLDRLEKLVPVVEVLSGREVVAVFAVTAEVEVFDESDEEGIYTASLD